MWIHNECSFIGETQYETVNNTNCTWICPKCEFFNFSVSFFGEQVNLETENRFVPLTKEKKDRPGDYRVTDEALELFILFAASAFRKLSSIYVFSYFPFGFEGRIWDLIVSVPDHCLSFYFTFISRNYVVWPTFFHMNVFIALKGSHFWFYIWLHCSWCCAVWRPLNVSPYINHSAVYILFWSFEISDNILRNKK